MARPMQYSATGINVLSGGSITLAAGATLDTSAGTHTAGAYTPASINTAGAIRGQTTLEVNGIASFGTHGAAETTVSATGAVRVNTTLEVNGISSFGTHGAAECTIGATGGITTATASRFSGTLEVNGATSFGTHGAAEASISAVGVGTFASLVIGAGAGTISDAVATLTLTETNIDLVGATTVTATTPTFTIASGAVTPGLILTGAGNKSAAAFAALGAHWGDGGTPAFVADQGYWRVSIEGVVYNIPLFADA